MPAGGVNVNSPDPAADTAVGDAVAAGSVLSARMVVALLPRTVVGVVLDEQAADPSSPRIVINVRKGSAGFLIGNLLCETKWAGLLAACASWTNAMALTSIRDRIVLVLT